MSKWLVSHIIHRAEYISVEVEAGTPEEALEIGKGVITNHSTAEYEPGEVVWEDPNFEVEPSLGID